MNREIKFRAISEETDDMRYGSLTVEYDGTCHINWWISLCIEPENNYYEPAPFFEVVKKETIGQYTGLKDKNGKEIYEGDIIKEYDEIVTVFYNDCTASFDILYAGGDCDRLIYKDGHSEHEFEVLGNIHENPEILQDGN